MTSDSQLTPDENALSVRSASERELIHIKSPRKRKHNEIESSTKKKVKRPVKSKMQLSEQMLRDSPAKEYVIDEVILATIPGYSPWPARILSITGRTISIEFFGTGQMYVVQLDYYIQFKFLISSIRFIIHRNLVRSTSKTPFSVNKTIPLLSRKGYKKAMVELEFILGISANVSLFQSTK